MSLPAILLFHLFLFTLVNCAVPDDALRPNFYNLTESQIQQYEQRFEQGLLHQVARKHGYDLWQCQHGNLRFLPQHRVFIRELEAEMNDVLPYWDWTLPLEDRVRTLVNGPVFRQVFRTNRNFRNPWPQQTLLLGVQRALEQTTFEDFSMQIESIHNALHVWVGGSMASVTLASYDPIFWLHHQFVNYVWAQWQFLNRNNKIEYPLELFTDEEILAIEQYQGFGFDFQPPVNTTQPPSTNTTEAVDEEDEDQPHFQGLVASVVLNQFRSFLGLSQPSNCQNHLVIEFDQMRMSKSPAIALLYSDKKLIGELAFFGMGGMSNLPILPKVSFPLPLESVTPDELEYIQEEPDAFARSLVIIAHNAITGAPVSSDFYLELHSIKGRWECI